jgi:hypothetical protein
VWNISVALVREGEFSTPTHREFYSEHQKLAEALSSHSSVTLCFCGESIAGNASDLP